MTCFLIILMVFVYLPFLLASQSSQQSITRFNTSAFHPINQGDHQKSAFSRYKSTGKNYNNRLSSKERKRKRPVNVHEQPPYLRYMAPTTIDLTAEKAELPAFEDVKKLDPIIPQPKRPRSGNNLHMISQQSFPVGPQPSTVSQQLPLDQMTNTVPLLPPIPTIQNMPLIHPGLLQQQRLLTFGWIESCKNFELNRFFSLISLRNELDDRLRNLQILFERAALIGEREHLLEQQRQIIEQQRLQLLLQSRDENFIAR